MSTAPPKDPPTRIGRYEIIRPLGQGGMAEVFLGRSVGPGGIAKRICIKRIRPRAVADPRALERFSQEARTSFELQHANIVTVFDFARDGQELFLAMEWIDGCDLATLLRALREEGQRLPPVLAAHVTAAVAKALGYAHGRVDHVGRAAGVLHRDVTPGNILLSRRGEVFLTDFGIARALGREGAPAGTPAYVAPEQARGEAGDARSDLYSLGLVLVEMLLGRRVRSEGSFEAARAPAVIPALDGVPGAIAAVARALLAAAPEERPASAAAVERALAPTLAEAVLRDGSSPEQGLAVLVERAAPRRGEPESAALATEAEATVAGATAEPAALPRRRRRLLGAAIAGTVVALSALLAWRLVPRATPPRARHTMTSRPAPPSRPPAEAMPASPAASAPPAPPVPARRRPAGAMAQLRVTAPGSWVTVYLDGRRLGDGPDLFEVPAGRHQLRVTNPPLRYERTMTIDARPGETVELEFHPGR
jgi:tRNA A-37 threonylcarbamoyl transferase component Bud32